MRKMKDSGSEKIGEIPVDWTVVPLKYLVTFMPHDKMDLHDEDTVGYLPMEQLHTGWMTPTEKSYGKLTTGLTYFANDDIVMAKVTPCFENGEIAVASNLARGIGFGSSELFVFRAQEMDRDYLFYFLQNPRFIADCASTMVGTGGLKRISTTYLMRYEIPLPPREEQKRFSNFLKQYSAKIDRMMHRAQHLIDQLNEYKQSLITETVTKGLHPEVARKDSGIKWIGEIPDSWNVGQIKYFVSIKAGMTLGKKYTESEKARLVERPYLRVANVQNGHLWLDDVKFINVLPEEIDDFTLHDGDLLMNEGGDRDKLARGCIWHNEIEGCLHQNHVFAVRTKENLDVKYLAYVTASDVGRNYFDLTAKKTTNLASTNSSTILKFKIPIPSYEEQHDIVSFLDEKCSAIDAKIAKRRKLMNELSEYKRSLIYEVVTGKREV